MPEELQDIETLPFWLKPLKEEDKPRYSECDKKIIAFSIAFEGSIFISKTQKGYRAGINLTNTDFELLSNFIKIVKFGTVSVPQQTHPKDKPFKVWQMYSIHEIFFLLEQLKGFMPCERYRRLRRLVTEFCKSRIEAHSKGKREAPYNERDLEIIKEVKKLNEKGKKNELSQCPKI